MVAGPTYNALSGVAVIVGKHTGKLLFLGVKNKFCSICARAEEKNETVKTHLCYKNWHSSSSAMEPSIIVEGFNASISMHKLKYTTFIVDGASPDGITNDDELVEVKCLYKVANLKKAVEDKLVPCLRISENNEIILNTGHDYYVQIQGQLAICRKNICYFVVYSGDKNELFIQKIDKDLNFWEKHLPKLKRFFEECIAPEIVLNRRQKGLNCRDPPYILEAIKRENEIKTERERKRRVTS